jgi:hypothetical protein
MESFVVTLIFILGGLTFLVNWAFLVLKEKSGTKPDSPMATLKRLVVYFLLSSLGVLISGVLFVSIFMLAHG